MKQLRILTGTHAGVHLDLSAARYVIGADDEADIQLLDWKLPPLLIEVDTDETVQIAEDPTNEERTGRVSLERLKDFTPRRQGDIVLCVGPAGAAWPSDIDLINRLAGPTAVDAADARQRPVRGRRLLWAGVGSLLMTAGVGAVLAHLPFGARSAQAPVSVPIVEPLQQRVERIVDAFDKGTLQVARMGEAVIVRGLVDTPDAAGQLRDLLDALGSQQVLHAYAAAPILAQQIAEGLGQSGLEVRHLGNGIFQVRGRAPDPARVLQTAERIAADLGALVQRIEVAVDPLVTDDTRPLSAALVQDGMQYVQTRDGIKHLVMSPLPVVDDTVPPSGEINPDSAQRRALED